MHVLSFKNRLSVTFRWLAVAAFAALSPHIASAQDEPPAEAKPLRALLVTGGCCHDYDRQKLILSRGISARTDVEWTLVQQGGTGTRAKIPLYENDNWYEGYDIVVHNECFADVRDVDWVERIVKPHREGLPAILIHCAMHCYRTGTEKWFEFVGVQSPNHGRQFPFNVENLKADHPIMAQFGDGWRTPQGELYNTIKVFPTATPLAHARRRGDNEPQVCIWTNQYGQGRVFATTIGHHNETMVQPEYLDVLARGLLWATDRDVDAGFKKTDEATNDEIKALATIAIDGRSAQPVSTQVPCCGGDDVSLNQPVHPASR
jgi:type 1 glutamine amidotransferase